MKLYLFRRRDNFTFTLPYILSLKSDMQKQLEVNSMTDVSVEWACHTEHIEQNW